LKEKDYVIFLLTIDAPAIKKPSVKADGFFIGTDDEYFFTLYVKASFFCLQNFLIFQKLVADI
jgi:hypothetical protein